MNMIITGLHYLVVCQLQAMEKKIWASAFPFPFFFFLIINKMHILEGFEITKALDAWDKIRSFIY